MIKPARYFSLISLLCAVCPGNVLADAQTLDLAGKWQLQLDAEDKGIAAEQWEKPFADTIQLPGTTALAGKGDALDIPINLERPAMQSLHQRFRYVGPAWYQRTVTIPADWKDRDITLSLERVIWETRVWVNGVEAGGPKLSLTTPHRYDLTGLLKPGQENLLTIRVDNREKVPIGTIGHGYTDETQTIWNGVVGKIQLEARDKVRIENLRLRPDLERGGVEVTLFTHNGTGQAVEAPELMLQVVPKNFDGDALKPLQSSATIGPGDATLELFFPMGDTFERWSEFNPKYYELRATIDGKGFHSEVADVFGMREFKTDGRIFTINGQPTFLRGTLQCAEFPRTGHPDMTGEQWEKIFTTARAYGLNHLRFHSWCPPQVAFDVADRLGFYLQVELPNWTFNMGKKPAVDNWLEDEANRIFREYGNHPSFVLFSLGNELKGDFKKVDEFVARLRQLEPKLMFTSTAFSFSDRGKSPGPKDDFFVSQETESGWVRGQGFLNNTSPNTDSDYAAGLSSVKIPLLTHEVGQYVVYPNLAELPKYESTPMRATAWEAIKADLEGKGRLDEAAAYTRDSGKLAVLLYKEDLERALRTKDLAGIQLLQLQDFPGQSTATVGLLDAFWDSKSLVTPEKFREFCSPIVPLIRMPKMVFENDETFDATVELANFDAAPLTSAEVTWKISDDTKVVGEGTFSSPSIPIGNGFQLGRISQSLASVKTAKKLTVSVTVADTDAHNEWNIWVYPKESPVAEEGVQIFQRPTDAFYQALRDGGRVLLLPPRRAVKSPVDGRFIPVFWSPLHFPNQPGTLGAMIDKTHPVWRDFPTETFTDWQWWELLSTSFAMNLDGVGAPLAMPFRFVDKYNRNALPAGIFEARVGDGKLLVCTLDISMDLDSRIVARQLRRSLLSYMKGESFAPSGELSAAQLRDMFQTAESAVRASSSHPDHSVKFATDDDPTTFWHTDWSTGNKLPAQFEVDMQSEKLLLGFNYTPRQDMNRGRIKRYAVEVSQDGEKWRRLGRPSTFPDSGDRQGVTFRRPAHARYMRIIVTSAHGNEPHAAIAELEPLADEIPPDVRDLGIVPGFNDEE